MKSSVTLAPTIRNSDYKLLDTLIEKVQKDLVKKIQKYLDAITSTWNHKPKWVITRSKGEITISTDDDIFRFLDEGTSVRRAVMTNDFVPKTYERQLYSGDGAGGVKFVSNNVSKPGIKAREWLDTIAREIEKIGSELYQVAVNNWIDEVGL